ncbi:MAG: hypothetical protein ACFBWO_09315 [Paracoccaceae bacterium]
MQQRDEEADEREAQRINLLLLNDALETGVAAEVAGALRLMGDDRVKVRSLHGGGSMNLAEAFAILEQSGLRLVAVPTLPRRGGATPRG